MREEITGSRRALLFFGAAWYALSILPLAATYTSPRHLYLPSFGLCVALGLWLSRAGTRHRVALTVVLAAFIALSAAYLFRKGWQWRQAAQLSERMRDDLQQIVREVPDGSGLILVNTPGFERGLFVWAWATPFVFREPFSDSDLPRRFRVIDAPSSYCCQWAQDKVPALRDLMAHPVDSYLIYLDENRRLNKRHLPRDAVRTLLGRLLDPNPGGVTKDGNVENAGLLAADWELFWRAHLKL
ncbi:MAG: hypothetical protein H0T45_05950 [Pyrinomonadaceae bacterium]|nr:hypothetical protein [Pyrinomonadaceae bacterium]